MNSSQNSQKDAELTVVFDNIRYSSQLQTNWGYSCVVKYGEKIILFDTGSSGEILLKNMIQVQIDPSTINSVVISHTHWDHLDGLGKLSQLNPNVPVFIPNSSSNKIEEDILKTGAESIRVKSSIKIAEGIFSSGELNGKIPEQSLVVQTEKGIVLITGCAHPGIVNIINHTRSIFNQEVIYLAMGGFHLKDDNRKKITRTVRTIFDLNVEHVAPSHCTGEEAIKEFENVFNTNFIASGAGKRIIMKGGE